MIPVTIYLPMTLQHNTSATRLAHYVLEDFAVQEYAQGRLTLAATATRVCKADTQRMASKTRRVFYLWEYQGSGYRATA
jgi:hypothetical protein